MSKNYVYMGHEAPVLYKDHRVRDVVLVLTGPCIVVCASSLVSVPQSTSLVVLAQFLCLRLTRTERDEGNLGRKRGEREEGKWMARVSNLTKSWTTWNSHFLWLELLFWSQFFFLNSISIIWCPMKIRIYLLSFISSITCFYKIQTYLIQQNSENKFSKKFSFFSLKKKVKKNLPQIITSLLVLYCCI